MLDFVIERVRQFKKKGYPEKDIAKFFGYDNVAELRKALSRRHRENQIVMASLATEMKENGETIETIAKELNVGETTVRLLLQYPDVESIKQHKIEIAEKIILGV